MPPPSCSVIDIRHGLHGKRRYICGRDSTTVNVLLESKRVSSAGIGDGSGDSAQGDLSVFGCVVNLVKLAIGLCVFSLPTAAYGLGWIGCPVGFGLVAILCVVSTDCFTDVMEKLESRGSASLKGTASPASDPATVSQVLRQFATVRQMGEDVKYAVRMNKSDAYAVRMHLESKLNEYADTWDAAALLNDCPVSAGLRKKLEGLASITYAIWDGNINKLTCPTNLVQRLAEFDQEEQSGEDAKFTIEGTTKIIAVEDVYKHAFGKVAFGIVCFLQNFAMGGSVCIALIILGRALNTLVPALSVAAWLWIYCIMLLPLCWITEMNKLAKVSIVGLIGTVVFMIGVIVAGFLAFSDHHEYMENLIDDKNGSEKPLEIPTEAPPSPAVPLFGGVSDFVRAAAPLTWALGFNIFTPPLRNS